MENESLVDLPFDDTQKYASRLVYSLSRSNLVSQSHQNYPSGASLCIREPALTRLAFHISVFLAPRCAFGVGPLVR